MTVNKNTLSAPPETAATNRTPWSDGKLERNLEISS